MTKLVIRTICSLSGGKMILCKFQHTFLRKPWCFRPGMEQITRPQFYHPKPGNFSFRMEGAMDGDESFSDGHKPVAYITHDCHKKAQQVELVLTVNTLCKTEK